MNKRIITIGLFTSMLMPNFTVMAEDNINLDAAQQYNQLIDKLEKNKTEYKSLDLSTGLTVKAAMNNGDILPIEFIAKGSVSSNLKSTEFDLLLNMEEEESLNYKLILEDGWIYLLDPTVGDWTKKSIKDNEEYTNNKHNINILLKNGGKLSDELSVVFNKYFELVCEEESNITIFSLKEDIDENELYDDVKNILSNNKELVNSMDKNESLLESVIKQFVEYSPVLEIGMDSDLGDIKYINFDININKELLIDELKGTLLDNILSELNSVDIELNSALEARDDELNIIIPEEAQNATEVGNELNMTNIKSDTTDLLDNIKELNKESELESETKTKNE